MNGLDNYINILIENTKNLTEIEKVRYVYIHLGTRLSFNLGFAFGNSKEREKIYRRCTRDKKILTECFESKKIICLTTAYLLEYIIRQLGINVKTSVKKQECRKYDHYLNLITLCDGKQILVDLQSDLEFIQTGMKTRYFDEGSSLCPGELEKIDKKIGYISDEREYTDNYFYLIEKAISNDIPLEQKIEFILSNVDSYCDIKEIGYIERRWYYHNFISGLLTKKELNKIYFIDTYKKDSDNEHQLCIVVDRANQDNRVFIYSNDSRCFNNTSLAELAIAIGNGLKTNQTIPGIKKYTRKNN